MIVANPRCRPSSSISMISLVLPLVDRATMQSPGPISPRSPWAASPGWTNAAGVPVEHSVAANFRATCPALPIPVVSTLPRQSRMATTALSYAESTRTARMASASASMTALMRAEMRCGGWLESMIWLVLYLPAGEARRAAAIRFTAGSRATLPARGLRAAAHR